MNKNEKFVITINREVGSGGRTIGEIMAAKLGVTFYDKGVIDALCKKYNLSVKEIESLKGREHDWWSDFLRVLGFVEENTSSVINEPDLLNASDVFKAEIKILQDLAEAGSCVIAGRSGFFVFQDHPNRLNILITSPMEQRIQRIVNKHGMSTEEAAKIIEDVDKMRENYVKKFAGTTRYDTRNYDLVINRGGKTDEEMADLIVQYIG